MSDLTGGVTYEIGMERFRNNFSWFPGDWGGNRAVNYISGYFK